MNGVVVNSVVQNGEGDIVSQVRALLQARSPIAQREIPNAAKAMPSILAAPQAAAPKAVVPSPASTAVTEPEPAAETSVAPRTGAFSSLRSYVVLSLLLTAVGLGAVVKGNQTYGSEMYDPQGMVPAAEAAADDLNYAVFDLNLNIRHLRDETVARMSKTPDVVLLGASHWQEAHAGLVTAGSMYNCAYSPRLLGRPTWRCRYL